MNAHAYEYREILLKVSGLSKSLGGQPVLRNLDLEIKDIHRAGLTQGQVVALLGPSGIGKTTLFRVLAGLDAPDSGTVLVGAEQKPVHRGGVGVVAQDYPLFAHRTVMGNLVLAGRLVGPSKAEATTLAIDLLNRFGISTTKSQYPAQLSGGQRQRVAIAQQFMGGEPLLLMDEPFSGLDLVNQHAVSAFIREIAASDELKTIIVVTHDIMAAIEVSDTLWLLGRDRNEKGEIVPGSRIQASYNLIERGLAWQTEGVSTTPECQALLREIHEAFPRL